MRAQRQSPVRGEGSFAAAARAARRGSGKRRRAAGSTRERGAAPSGASTGAFEALELRGGEQTKTLPVDGLFIAVGQQPANEPFRDLVRLDEAGYIAAGEDCQTSEPGVFAAGDCRQKAVRQLVTAAADGAVAGLAANAYLDGLNS